MNLPVLMPTALLDEACWPVDEGVDPEPVFEDEEEWLEVEEVARVEAGEDDELEPPRGAVLAPAIWDCSSGVNCPVPPLNVNLAEKAKAGYCGLVASLRLSDSKRMK
jgi:hypothetical protein